MYRQTEQRRGVPAAGSRRGGHVVVVGGAPGPRRRPRAPLTHAARTHRARTQEEVLLHPQEEVLILYINHLYVYIHQRDTITKKYFYAIIILRQILLEYRAEVQNN